jgi:3-oxoadipate enol-lactonase
MVGMWLAAHHPDRVERLTLICTSAYLPPAEGWLQRAEAVRERGTASIVDGVVARWFTPAFPTRHPDVVASLVDGFRAIPDEGYAGCCEAIAAMDLRPVLHRISAPTLVIAGAEDPAAPPTHGQAIAAGIPGARFEVLPNASHLASVEQSEAVTALLQ